MDNKFPKDFLWGASSSAYQVEGGIRNDWSEWEEKNADRLASEMPLTFHEWQRKKFPEMYTRENYICGQACDHYNRYEEDFNLLKNFNLNAYRFSIEWARIEPEEGEFDEKEIAHYKKVIQALKERNIEPFITLWHYTNPRWIRDIGGWENKKTIDYFLRYVGKILKNFPEIKFWVVLNEPTVYASLSYIKGTQPPGVKNIFRSRKVINNLVKAYLNAYDLIHSFGKDMMVSSPYSVNYWIPYRNRLSNRILSGFMNYLEGHFLKKIKNKADFIALQYYRSITIGFKLGGNFLGIISNDLNDDEDTNDLRWKIYPEGIYYFLKKNSVFGLPIYITENGIADANDEKRTKFIKDHIFWIKKAIREGADIRGYFHWSLMDNFEFVEIRGFWPRFGLVEIDYKTLERKPRKSFYEYQRIIKNNGL
jgi:beta-glucosidase